MRRKLLFLLWIMGVNLSVISQNLIVEQDFKRSGDCPSPESEACVTITANKSLKLSFTSNVDSVLDIAFKKQAGQNMEYTLFFPTDRLEYFDRILTVHCLSVASAESVQIPLLLGPKESEFYYVSLAECYKTHYERGLLLFKQCSYDNAKEVLKKAQDECFDAPKNDDVKNKIAVIDSIMKLRKTAKESYEMLDYKKAEEYYQIIHSLNNDDGFAEEKYIECRNESINLCNLYLLNARNYNSSHEYDKSQLLYKKVNENQCSFEAEEGDGTHTEQGENEFDKEEKKKREISRVLTYEWSWRAPFGFSYGSYKDKKVSAYFTILFNADVFMNTKAKNMPEFDLSFGLTARPVNNKYTPFWLTMGAGYTGSFGKYGVSSKFHHSVSPEIGILIKIPFGRDPKSGLAIRYNFQYRIPIFSNGIIPPCNHSVGLGFCF